MRLPLITFAPEGETGAATSAPSDQGAPPSSPSSGDAPNGAAGSNPSPTGDPHAGSQIGTPITGTAPDPSARHDLGNGQGSPETPADGLNGSDQPAGEQHSDWLAVLNDDNRALVQNKGWNDVNAMLTSYSELERKVGEKTLAPPSDEADKAEWDAFHTKMGRPESAEGYTFGMPEGVPEDMPYDQNFALDFRSMAHEAGLSARQASQLHDAYVRRMAGQYSQVIDTSNERIETSHNELVKDWGDVESDGYRQNHEFARRALNQLGLKEMFSEVGILQPGTGMVTDARAAKALARVGAAMFAEDEVYAGPGAGVDNPFSENTSNMTKQHLLIRNDPGRAASLIRAAGQNPADYGL